MGSCDLQPGDLDLFVNSCCALDVLIDIDNALNINRALFTTKNAAGLYGPLYWRNLVPTSLDVNIISSNAAKDTEVIDSGASFTGAVITQFDLSCCCIGLDADGLMLTTGFIEDNSKGVLRYVYN